MSWGPQAAGHAALPPVRSRHVGWWLWAGPVLWLVPGLFWVTGVMTALTLHHRGRPSPTTDATAIGLTLAAVGLAVLAGLLGLRGGRVRTGWLYRRPGLAIACLLVCFPQTLAYTAGYLAGRRGYRLPTLPHRPVRPTQDRQLQQLAATSDPAQALIDGVQAATGRLPGAVLGFSRDGDRRLLTAAPRGGVLVLGPPGSGKTSSVLIPSILLAPGACVSSSIKADVLHATAAARGRRGRVWHFDPGGDEHTPAGVTAVSWSPLVSVKTWEDALQVGKTMAEPATTAAGAGGEHFIGRATDWVQVLLYAAHLAGAPIGQVADWALAADDPDSQTEIVTLLETAKERGDLGAGIAVRKLAGLIATPDRERGSIISTMVGLLRVYDSTTARAIGAAPNFDPAAFVRSTDTLYITARPDKQTLYAPLLAALLEQIRFETYDRTKAEQAGLEAKHPHVTFALDEANTTAPIPLPAIISEAGGQGLHVIVGIQALGPAIARWGDAARSFLTLFPTKVIFRGVFDPDTVHALSNAAGEYDRQLVAYSRSTSYLGRRHTRIDQMNPATSIQRQKVLTEGDITAIPHGQALIWDGPTWTLATTQMHWNSPTWLAIAASRNLTSPSGAAGLTTQPDE